jgi:hypothetical protein
VFHGSLHVRGDPSTTSSRADEELHQCQQSSLAILLVAINPIIDNNLQRLKIKDLMRTIYPLLKYNISRLL